MWEDDISVIIRLLLPLSDLNFCIPWIKIKGQVTFLFHVVQNSHKWQASQKLPTTACSLKTSAEDADFENLISFLEEQIFYLFVLCCIGLNEKTHGDGLTSLWSY